MANYYQQPAINFGESPYRTDPEQEASQLVLGPNVIGNPGIPISKICYLIKRNESVLFATTNRHQADSFISEYNSLKTTMLSELNKKFNTDFILDEDLEMEIVPLKG